MTNLWRLHLKSDSLKKFASQEYCLSKNICGIGWQVDYEGITPLSKEDHEREANSKYKGQKGWSTARNAFKHRMNVGDLVWSRDRHGIYYLGRLTSDWRYENSPENRSVDLVNVRNCDWHEIGSESSIPGKVANHFRNRSTVQQIHDEGSIIYSEYVFSKKAVINFLNNHDKKTNLSSLLSWEDWEDVVGIYLQVQCNYYIIPSTCKNDTLAYEFELIDKYSKQIAVVQVKSGNDKLVINDYKQLAEKGIKVFLFATGERYGGELVSGIELLHLNVIEKFIFDNISLMPKKIQSWISILHEIDTVS